MGSVHVLQQAKNKPQSMCLRQRWVRLRLPTRADRSAPHSMLCPPVLFVAAGMPIISTSACSSGLGCKRAAATLWRSHLSAQQLTAGSIPFWLLLPACTACTPACFLHGGLTDHTQHHDLPRSRHPAAQWIGSVSHDCWRSRCSRINVHTIMSTKFFFKLLPVCCILAAGCVCGFACCSPPRVRLWLPTHQYNITRDSLIPRINVQIRSRISKNLQKPKENQHSRPVLGQDEIPYKTL